MAKFAKEFEEYYPKVYGYFFRRVNNKQDVEDLTSITLTKLFKSLENNKVKNTRAYLWMIAHNQLVDFYRSNKVRDIQTGMEEGWDVDASLDNHQSDNYKRFCHEMLDQARKHISTEDYNLIEMYYLDGYSSQEVADKLNLTPANTRKKVSRIINKLRKLIPNYV